METAPVNEKEVVKPEKCGGIAHIKPQFVVSVPAVRTCNLEFVSKSDQEKLDETQTNGEQPKKKFKGQNKRRPKETRQPKDQKLCPFVVKDQCCPYTDKCFYTHDVPKFLENKPEDIAGPCHLQRTFGSCHFGLTCRFATSHSNGAAAESKGHVERKELTENQLDKDLQIVLRKRQYDFSKSEKVLKGLSSDKIKTTGPFTDCDVVAPRLPEIKEIDWKGKTMLAPLTTVGNLPFRRICKRFGADVTCGEMALCSNLLQGQQSEWALLKRHRSEDIFGVQLCGAHPDMMTKCAQLLTERAHVDFIDVNVGCPIDLIFKKGAGCGLMGRQKKLFGIVEGMKSVMTVPLTVKLRTGIYDNKNTAHLLLPSLRQWGVSMTALHGRSKEQRYTKVADWEYIERCAQAAQPMPLFGVGDVLSYEDVEQHFAAQSSVTGVMIARGALIKPWIFTEIRERRHWDISASERLDVVRDFVNFGLEHWGSDAEGVEKTRRFLLEWLSFAYRYVPVGVLERVPQKINERPPCYVGRDDMETLLSSSNCADWINISEMFLGKVPESFSFLPKHKANSYQ